MVELEKVCCGYTSEMIVKNISFAVEKGEKICIVGPNGCGKSTLLKAIVGLIAYEGTVDVMGKEIGEMKHIEIANRVAFMSQISGASFSYTVFETVMLGRYAKTKHSVFAKADCTDIKFVEDCLEIVGISELRDRPITELSGGELQRVFLAKVFAQDPNIIILDEPTNHLDLKYQIEIMSHLDNWTKFGDRAVIAVLHDINLALGFADKILLMSQGEQIAFSSCESLLKTELFNSVYGIDIKTYMQSSLEKWRA